MKNKFLPAVFSLFLTGSFLSCNVGNDTKVSLTESKTALTFSAYFPDRKTARVQEFINDQLEHKSIFNTYNSEVEGAITLNDQTTFYLKSKAGKLEINFNKEENNEASVQRIKKLCEGVKSVLTKD
ncbi:MAG: hypothetical protein ACKVOW_03060 [Chitinophagaceae bacterium]